MKIRGTDFIMFQVSNLSRSIEFYRDVLGLPLEIASEEYHWAEFNCGNVTLALHATPHGCGTPASTRIALAVEDIDAAYEELVAKHADVAQHPQDHGVCRAFDIRDPDGNMILLHHRADGSCGQLTTGQMPTHDQHALSAR